VFVKIDFLKINERQIQSMNARALPKPSNEVNKAVGSFGDYLKDGIDKVNALDHDSRQITQKFMMGEVENIHDVTIAAEKAGLAFRTMMSLRKKMTDAYRELTQIRL
jgi:flagellar hook-basal body complex protein FliE